MLQFCIHHFYISMFLSLQITAKMDLTPFNSLHMRFTSISFISSFHVLVLASFYASKEQEPYGSMSSYGYLIWILDCTSVDSVRGDIRNCIEEILSGDPYFVKPAMKSNL